MKGTSQPVSKTRMIVMWVILVSNLVFWCTFWLFRRRPQSNPAFEEGPSVIGSIVLLVIGGFCFFAGVAAYFVVLSSDVFTYNFSRPVWQKAKVKIYVANILVPIASMVGLGVILSGFITPVLISFGLTRQMAMMLPFFAVIVLVQMSLVWVLIWSPLEKRLITKRLMAQGITKAQIESAIFIGISNPGSGMLKRFGAIEEDIGALWIVPDQLVYWGDSERFSITRDQVVQIERKADNRSTTMLSGVAHVILHVRLPNGERQIRLHNEGVWSMGQKRKAMNQLAAAIENWYAGTMQQAAAG
jgi:hypothetical protein